MNPENRPPPPPLPPSFSPSKIIYAPKKDIKITEEEKIQEFQSIIERAQPKNHLKEPFYSHYSYLEPQLQDGPKCGLVALNIASNSNIDELLNTAVTKGYSKQGEMFNVEWLAELSTKFFKTRIIENRLSSHISCILHCLLNNGFVLIPYDADFNHTPCLKQGHKAHWAVISGFVIFVPNFSSKVFLQSDKNICKCLESFEVNGIKIKGDNGKIIINKFNEKACDDINEGKLFVAARQGKSRHLALWKFNELDSSNFNLTEFSPDREFGEYVLPPGGVSQGLRGKAILLYPKEK